jgi:hypothetical protein
MVEYLRSFKHKIISTNRNNLTSCFPFISLALLLWLRIQVLTLILSKNGESRDLCLITYFRRSGFSFFLLNIAHYNKCWGKFLLFLSECKNGTICSWNPVGWKRAKFRVMVDEYIEVLYSHVWKLSKLFFKRGRGIRKSSRGMKYIIHLYLNITTKPHYTINIC